jgi:hypothetical protein
MFFGLLVQVICCPSGGQRLALDPQRAHWAYTKSSCCRTYVPNLGLLGRNQGASRRPSWEMAWQTMRRSPLSLLGPLGSCRGPLAVLVCGLTTRIVLSCPFRRKRGWRPPRIEQEGQYSTCRPSLCPLLFSAYDGVVGESGSHSTSVEHGLSHVNLARASAAPTSPCQAVHQWAGDALLARRRCTMPSEQLHSCSGWP